MEPFLGQIMPVGFNFAPRGWALCDGQFLPISQNSAVFSLLGTTFGGDGRTIFGLPDLRSRSIRHVGSGPGLDQVFWGQKGGYHKQTLTVNQIPPHNHSAQISLGNSVGNNKTGNNDYMAKNDGGANIYTDVPPGNQKLHVDSVLVNNTGGGQPFSTLNPYLGIYVCIALTGIYPSRS